MTHAGFVGAAYALGVAVPAGFGLLAALRLRLARRRLAAVDRRSTR